MSAPANGQVTVPCDDLAAALTALVEAAGFGLQSIYPADAPRVAIVEGHGVSLRLEAAELVGQSSPITLRLDRADADQNTPPQRQRIAGAQLEILWGSKSLPQPALTDDWSRDVIVRQHHTSPWGVGRAGMHYRDLIPHRCGGRIIASHIRIEDGGPVPDQVHFHDVAFQVICCINGWVDLVYEDQGPPFRMQAGDVVLQPPEIRHRVLESSAGLEVVEITTPAEHPTLMDHTMALPTATARPRRSFGGQRFVHHQGDQATWHRDASGLEVQDTEIGAATDHRGTVRWLRAAQRGGPASLPSSPAGLARTLFVVRGGIQRVIDGETQSLGQGDSAFDPTGGGLGPVSWGSETSLLEVCAGIS